MKAEFYLTLLDGLLATAVYHPHKPGIFQRTTAFWSVPLCSHEWELVDFVRTTITAVPVSVSCESEPGEERGMRTSATPVCRYRLSLHDDV